MSGFRRKLIMSNQNNKGNPIKCLEIESLSIYPSTGVPKYLDEYKFWGSDDTVYFTLSTNEEYTTETIFTLEFAHYSVGPLSFIVLNLENGEQKKYPLDGWGKGNTSYEEYDGKKIKFKIKNDFKFKVRVDKENNEYYITESNVVLISSELPELS